MVRKKEFEKFYQDNIDKIYRFVFFRVNKDKELAEDLVSEIFMKALEHFESYDKKISACAWLYTIAKNHIANYWRDKKDVQTLPESAAEDDEEGVGLDDVWFKVAVDKFKKTSEKNTVYDILTKLAPEDKQIVTFHYLFGYNYSEIGQMIGKGESAVKVAAHRAIKKLKQLL